QAAGEARWLFDQVWHLPYRDVTTADIKAGLPGIDVLLVPNGYTNYGLQALGSKGKTALQDWVAGGGRFVGIQGGAQIATRSGVSTATFTASHTNMPGSLVRVSMAPSSPLSAGVGPTAWVMYQDDALMQPGAGASAATYPGGSSPAFGVSGLDEGDGQLAGSAAVADERVGDGRAVLFAVDPTFRGWTQGTERILWNALVGPDPATSSGISIGSAARTEAVREARSASAELPELGSTIRIAVARADARATAAALRSYGARFVRQRLGAGVPFPLAHPPHPP